MTCTSDSGQVERVLGQVESVGLRKYLGSRAEGAECL